MKRFLAVGFLSGLMIAAGPLGGPSRGAQAPPAANSKTVLEVAGVVPNALKFDAESFARLPRQSVQIKERDGSTVTFEGVALSEALKAAGVTFGEDLRGLALADYVVVEAADGYRVVFALPELDPAATDRVVLLADRRDDKPLDAKDGPLRIVVPGEKRHFRWVRQVVALKIGRS